MNPALYSIAQNASGVFHDIISGNNIVTITCGPRSRSCTAGSFGFTTTPGYDQVTGLGSVDVYSLVTQWSNGSAAANP